MATVRIDYEANTEALDRLTQQLRAAEEAGEQNTAMLRANIAELERQQEEARRAAQAEENLGEASQQAGDAFGKVGGSAAKLSGVLNTLVPGLGDSVAGLADFADAGEVGAEVSGSFGSAIAANAAVLGTLAAALGVAYVAYQASNREIERINELRALEKQLAQELTGAEQGLQDALQAQALATGLLSEAEDAQLTIRRQIQRTTLEALATHAEERRGLEESIESTQKYINLQRGLAAALAVVYDVSAGLPGVLAEMARTGKGFAEVIKEDIIALDGAFDAVTGLESGVEHTRGKIKAMDEAAAQQAATLKATKDALIAADKATRGLALSQEEAAAYVALVNQEFATQQALSQAATANYQGLIDELLSLEAAAVEARLDLRRSELEKLDHARNAEVEKEKLKYDRELALLAGNISAQETLTESYRAFREATDAKYEAQKTALIEDALAERADREAEAAAQAQAIREGQLEAIRSAEAEKTALANEYNQAALDLSAQLVQSVSDGLAELVTRTGASELEIFRIRKASALALAAVQAAGAILTALQTPPPLTIPAVAIAGITAGINIALIAAQQPPSFRTGGLIGPDAAATAQAASLPDARLISAEVGEAILTRQGVEAEGGEEAIRRRNAGMRAEPVVVDLKLRHEVLDRVLTEQLQRPTALRGATVGSRRGVTNPYRNRS